MGRIACYAGNMPNDDGKDTHDRLLRLEIELESWRTSVERRLSECSVVTRWVIGFLLAGAVSIVTAVITKAL